MAHTSTELALRWLVQLLHRGFHSPLSVSVINVIEDMLASSGIWQSAHAKHLRCTVCPCTVTLSLGSDRGQDSPQITHWFEESSNRSIASRELPQLRNNSNKQS